MCSLTFTAGVGVKMKTGIIDSDKSRVNKMVDKPISKRGLIDPSLFEIAYAKRRVRTVPIREGGELFLNTKEKIFNVATGNPYFVSIPKIQRYTLWQNCENTTLAIIKNLIRTRRGSEQKRRAVLEEISENIDLLKVMVRLAKEIHAISIKNYVMMAEILDEMGRMSGGWIKSASH